MWAGLLSRQQCAWGTYSKGGWIRGGGGKSGGGGRVTGRVVLCDGLCCSFAFKLHISINYKEKHDELNTGCLPKYRHMKTVIPASGLYWSPLVSQRLHLESRTVLPHPDARDLSTAVASMKISGLRVL